jgi:DNA-binding NarL/FixJ family response regulator
MRVFWEQIGVLLPVYELAGAGFDDRDIAIKLNVTEERVQTCMTWLLHFLKLATRNQLVQYASGGSLSL